jgi:uncharacterized protein (DUF1499 family)
MRWLIGILGVVVLVVLGLRLFLSRDEEGQVRPGEAADFAHLQFAHRDNIYLLCPSAPSFCSEPADAAAPVFAVDVAQLRSYLLALPSTEPRLTLVSEDPGGHRFIFIQRSFLFRFPDIVTVQLIPLDGGRSTLAILSRSRYGRSDLGVNGARVRRWIGKLQEATSS